MKSLNNIRSVFLHYFKKNGHEVVHSSPLVPHNDPTLMFTNSGMVQFKNVFTGNEKRPYTRATSSQKSVRAGGKHNDLDNVGYTARHHTFFEMLGNFSFSDYFKEEAIFYAWNLLTKDFALPKDKLYVTVYHTDDEARNYWKKIAGFSDDKIISIENDDNFWSMGDTGPCGPCSEIFYDHGEKIAGGLPGTKDADGDRYIEIWNLVFMQFEQLKDGSRVNLPKPCVDTGMGLERISAVLQSVHDNYDIDLFKNLINAAENIIKKEPKGVALNSYRVIADHLRASAFLLADGVMPSNENRGYVLRRIMRRSMRHVYQLGYNEPLMYKLLPALINEMGQAYPELIRGEKLIKEILYLEEFNFRNTLGKGLKLLEESKTANTKKLSGEIAFKLYDTYGFPLDLTIDVLRKENIEVDVESFNDHMMEQKKRARASWIGSGEKQEDKLWFDIYMQYGATEFLGYSTDSIQAQILAIINIDDEYQYIVTNQTSFYGESGGQMGDIGTITKSDGSKIDVLDTKKFISNIHAHMVKKSNLEISESVFLCIDVEYRQKLKSNHSATHLLHFALRKLLGEHITQKGSLVAKDRLRFDISHHKPITMEEIVDIEKIVNRSIRENSHVSTKIMCTEDAVKEGAMALFGEKYADEVRVVTMGNSVELCGGTHVKYSGEIGLFKIISESAIAAGIRRIEAITGEEALLYIQNQENILLNISSTLKSPVSEVKYRVIQLVEEKKKLEKNLAENRKKNLLHDNSKDTEKINGINFITKILSDISAKDLREMVDFLRQSNQSVIIVGITNFENKASIVVAISNDLTDKFDASIFVKNAMEKIGTTSGGGRKEIAQAGGFDFSSAKILVQTIKDSIII